MSVVDDVLDNPCWNALTSRHDAFAERLGSAARYRPEVSVFAGIEALTAAAWADLAELAGPGEEVTLLRHEVGVAPSGWTEIVRGPGIQMVARDRLAPVADVERRALGPGDADAMVALVALTEPGPFRPRTFELGGYLGHFEGTRLIAMAGERLSVDGFTEISAVCTHPDARGRGLAASLTSAVADNISARGDVPILHVGGFNTPARRIYERLGFDVRREMTYVQLRTPT